MPAKRTININKHERYKLVLLRVISRLEDGTPDNVQILGLDQTAELSENPDENCFITAYIPDERYDQFAGQIPTC